MSRGGGGDIGLFLLICIGAIIYWIVEAMPYILLIGIVVGIIYLSVLIFQKKEKEKKQVQQREAERQRREEWSAKMVAAKLQKKQERERKKAELLAEKRVYCAQLEKELDSIGLSFSCPREFCYDIIASEEIDVAELFRLLKFINSAPSDFNIEYNCVIIDTNKEELIEITGRLDWALSLYFYQEENEMAFYKGDGTKQAERFLLCYLGNRKIKRLETALATIIEGGIAQVDKLTTSGDTIEEKVCSALESSNHNFASPKNVECLKDGSMLIVDYELPTTRNLLDVKEYKYVASKKEVSIKKYSDTYIAKRYENVLYSIVLRSLYEIFAIDTTNEVEGLTFNGFVTQVNPATGNTERKCILSVQVNKNKFSQINISNVEPKACFKALKGVSAAKLIDISPITPILTFNKKDRRFIEGKDVSVNDGTNLAAMHWEDFEHLVRELFEMEFAQNGGEVRVTQASRDGGVDAIVFDPDPLRGGKIVIQAKRYTNTVGVSAVRDLYGTVINEGANSGILITTSDYGHDSYDFAKDKPLKLLNGGHLLALLHNNGRSAYINIDEAKKLQEEHNNLKNLK